MGLIPVAIIVLCGVDQKEKTADISQVMCVAIVLFKAFVLVLEARL